MAKELCYYDECLHDWTVNPGKFDLLLGKIYADTRFTPDKLRDLHFELLIALTARSHGARLITSNRSDFEMINRYRKLQLEIW